MPQPTYISRPLTAGHDGYVPSGRRRGSRYRFSYGDSKPAFSVDDALAHLSRSQNALPPPPAKLAPTVVAPHLAARGTTPRPLLVERRRRAYADDRTALGELVSSEVEHALSELPPLPPLPGPKAGEAVPLDLFDDDTFDVRAPADWIAAGGAVVAAVALPLAAGPSRAVDAAWAPCTVTAYSAETGAYTCVFAFPAPEEQLPRLRVCFEAEVSSRFASSPAPPRAPPSLLTPPPPLARRTPSPSPPAWAPPTGSARWPRALSDTTCTWTACRRTGCTSSSSTRR